MGTPADPLGWAMMAASAVKGVSSIVGGMNESAAMRSQAAAAEYEAKIADLRGIQAAGDRRQELNDVLGAIDSIRSGRGVSLDSATGRAIRRDRRESSRYAENIDVLNHRLEGSALRNQAAGLRRGAKWKKVKGFLDAIPDFASAAGGSPGFGGGSGG